MNRKKLSHRESPWLALIFAGLALVSISASVVAQSQPSGPQGDEETSAVTKPAEKTSTVAAPVAPPVLPPPPGTWTGWYFGGNIGHGWGDADTSFTPLPTAAQFINLAPTTLSPDPSGVIGGGQIGYNKQVGAWVFGPEFTFSVSDIKGTVTQTPIIQNNGTPFNGTLTAGQDIDWLSTLRWRVGGLPTPGRRLLLYVNGGWVIGRVNYTANADFRPTGTVQYPAAFQKTKHGWTIGGGADIAVAPHVSVGGEYFYYTLGKESFTANPAPANPPFQVAYTWQTKGHVVVGRINFHF